MNYRYSRFEYVRGLYELADIHCTVTVRSVVAVGIGVYVCVTTVVAIVVRRIAEGLRLIPQS